MTSHTTSARIARTTVAALGTGLLLAGCSLPDGLNDRARRTATADATVTEAVTAVRVTQARAGSIEVTPGTGPGVTIRRTVHYGEGAAPTPGQQVAGGVLTFTDGCSADCYVDYRLEVPANATVELESTSGGISVTGVAAAAVTATSGTVRADRIGGPLKVRTTSGDVTATGLSAASADVRSSSGDARLDFAGAPSSVLAETTSGNVTLKVPRAPYRLAVSTTSGDRDITLPDDASAPSSLSAKTTSGDVRISAV
ncbi:DUF4097 family beta strand repeat-containing protein [Streptomyces avidinii]|uniref:DUF4097 domain-containing protein n=1 Tax=Streptomyces avidinii TaxID=1895 RepID=A0ABS4LGU7_STRAV|nr:DUF4097 family beta strand repeat-containing protein [Streptomyces avidinii]MBP2041357.1 hypothetical protein [Streptomyces avidinii]GGZ19391.1 hypothetical protein GCM10010343_53600 [Streptomyces avidinii]